MIIELALAAALHPNMISAHRVADDTYRVTVSNVQASVVDPAVITFDGHGYAVGQFRHTVRRGGSFTVTIRFPRDDRFKVTSVDGTPLGNPEGATHWTSLHGRTSIRVI